MKLTKMLAAGTATLALLAIPQPPATAVSGGVSAAVTVQPAIMHPQVVKKLTAAQKKKLRAVWKKYGVKKSVQDKLIKKLEKGKKWNSLIKSAKAKKKKVYNRGGFKVTLRTYADGSIRVTEAQIPVAPVKSSAHIVPQGITATSGCGYTVGPTVWRATYCLVADSYVAFGIHARADYRVHITRDLTGTLEKVYEVGYYNVLGGFSVDTPVRFSDDEFHITAAYSNPAVFGGSGSSVCRIKVVSAGPLSVSSNAV